MSLSKWLLLYVCIVLGAVFPQGIFADPEDKTGPVTREEYNKVLDEIAELKLKFSDSEKGKSEDASQGRLPGNKGGLYDKPFLSDFTTFNYIKQL